MNAFDTQMLMRSLADNRPLANGLREYLLARRERNRTFLETANGEMAVVMRGQCRELTAVIAELFKE
jgi:hypothetical protein